jgi:membrane protease YdiL (CAAX protease family)
LTGWLGVIGLAYVVVVGLLVPAAAMRTARRLDAGLPFPSPESFYRATLIQLCIGGLLAAAVARLTGVLLFPAWRPSLQHAALGLGALLLLLAVVPWRLSHVGGEERRRLAFLMPRTRRQYAHYVPLALVAGMAEEIAYRGVLFRLLERWVGDPWLAGALAALSFGAGHWVQGRRAALVVALVAVLFQVLAAFTGALYVSMAVHAAYDLVAGAIYGRALSQGSQTSRETTGGESA